VPFSDIFPQGSPTQRQDLASPAQAGENETLSTSLEGRSGIYRLGFHSMEVPGLPTDVMVGSASVMQTVGPVRTQVVTIKQQPGLGPVFEKNMSHHEVGNGLHLTVCQIPIVVPSAQSVSIAMRMWRDKALAAVGLLVSLLDERIAQEQIFEDVVLFDGQGDPFAALDVRRDIRTFQSSNVVMRQHHEAMERLESVDLSANDPGLGAVRWYLRAAQAGPVPDSVVSFWIALEALTRPVTAGKSWDEVKGNFAITRGAKVMRSSR
jgi:hypothetical protein